jgi:hypothetical protein
MSTHPRWVAALERLPTDHRGYRRVLRLHAIERGTDGLEPQAVCGYDYSDDELRSERDWETVTHSGRCALWAQRLNRTGPPPVVDLVARDRPTGPIELDRRSTPRRLRSVPEPSEKPADG